MNTPLATLLFGFGVALAASVCGGESPPGDEEPIEIEALAPGDILYNYQSGVGVATNRFIIRFRDGSLTAGRGRFDERTGELVVEEGVLLQRDNQVWRGERLQYNFLTKTIQSSTFKAGRWPIYATGSGLEMDLTNNVYTASDAFVTSDDVSNPGVRVHASRLTIVPGRYFEARNAVLYVGKVPLFYYPYYRRSLDPRANRFSVLPGYRSRYGAYLLGTYDWFLGEDLGGTAHLDYRTERGFGTGLDLRYDVSQAGRGDLRSYYTHDLEADEVEGLEGEPVDVPKDRHWVYLAHRAEPRTNLTVTLALFEQSDAYVTRDFRETEYRENPQPASFLEVSKVWPNFSLDVLVHPQVNNFFETVERLPDVKLNALRQQLGPLPLFYEGESSVGYFSHRYADGSVSNDYSAFRADTFHQVLLPGTIGGWLNVTPRVGGRFTYYGETEGEGSTLDEQTRWVFTTGAEVSFKASRVWAATTNRFFQIDGLRHIVQPVFNYAYVPEPSARPPELPQFDRLMPSLRLLPVQFPDFNDIDAVDSQNVLRLGLRNKFQTKRGGQVENVVNWDLYTDWRIDPQPGQTDFADVFSDLDVRPWSWLTMTSELRIDPDDGVFRIANHMLTFEPGNVWSWSVGHRYLRESPELGFEEGHSLLLSTLYYRLSENWGLRLSHYYDIDDRRMAEQYYSLYRDFRSWTGALTFRVRQEEDEETDYGVAFTFQLKAFPRFKRGDDRNKPSLLLGS